MKKLITFGLFIATAGILIAGDQISPVVGNRQDRIIDELQINMNKLANSNGVMVVSKVTAVTNAVTTLAVSGVATLTGVPAFNAQLVANGTLTNGPSNLLPAGTTSTNGVWISISHNGTNGVIKFYPQ